jgi:dephospho-CoA kinase
MFIAGITGGIGSGKSIVAEMFRVLGVPVYDADRAAKRLMQEDEELKKQIINLFGESSYINGKLNTAYLSSVVFENPDQLDQLNKIIHPATIEDAKKWFSQQHAPYVVKEAALLFESGSVKDLDFVIGVFAPQTLRIKRVMNRNNMTAGDVKNRMKKQIDEQIKMRLCDEVINNDDTQLVIPQVLTVHEKLLEKSKHNKADK